MDNRRANPRFKFHQLVEISNSKEEIFINVYSINISVTGLLCTVKSPIRTNSEIYLMFEIPFNEEAHVIQCYGDIAWSKKVDELYQLGINFKHLSDLDKSVLENYLKQLS